MRDISKIEVLFFLMIYLLSVLVVSGQEPYFRTKFNTSDIEGNQVNCLFIDKSGFIWIGTNNGPVKYDGKSFSRPALDDSTSCKRITSILQDIKGNIWFGCENGSISTFDYLSQQVLLLENLKLNSKITSLLQTNDSSIIIGTYGSGIYIADKDKIQHLNTNSGLSDNYIYSMVIDHDDKIWVGTDNGISIIDLNNHDIQITLKTRDDGLPDFIILDLAISKDGIVWAGTHNRGVCYFSHEQNKFIVPKELEDWRFGPVTDILLLEKRVWITTKDKGIIDYIKSSGTVKNYKKYNDIDLLKMNQFLSDTEGNIWLSSKNEVCLSLGPKLEFLTKHEEFQVDNIQALTIDSMDKIWFANDQGVFRFDPNPLLQNEDLVHFPIAITTGEQKVMSLYEDPFGIIWIGTFGDGIIRMDPETRQQVLITEMNGLINGNVFSIKSTEDYIWLATLGGSSRCKITKELSDINKIPVFENYQEEEGLSNNFIYHIYTAKKRVWFATDGGGVSYYEDSLFSIISDSAEFEKKVVYSVAGDHFGNLWMNVANEGLFKYDGMEITQYFDDPGHKDLSFSGIHANNKNELIIVYNSGIDILDIKSGDIIHYEGNAGLSACNPNLNTIDSDSKGNVWVGTSIGLVKYSGTKVKVVTKPVSKINHVAVFLEKINHRHYFSFPHDQNHISFNYSGLWFQYPEKVEYLIQLEGHDLDWIPSKNNDVIYSNLKPGKYTFKVKSAMYGNFENASTATYSFVIDKPFWMHYWFYMALTIVVGVLLIALIKYRENRIRRKQEALQEKIRFQFENLKSQINPHFLFNSFSTLIALIESDQNVAVEYVEELSALFRNILEYKDKETISTGEELTIVDNYYNLHKRRYGKNLELIIDKKARSNFFRIPPMTLQMLIENAVKHNVVSKDKPLKIRISLDSDQSVIFVENNLQLKQDDVRSTGIGTQNIINRYKLLTEKQIVITQNDMVYRIGLPLLF